MPNTLADWLTYLESLHPKTIALGLERVAQVKQRLNLQPDFPIIVVGGTNGKGSVCAMLESILHAAGYRVGCYTSPHLLHYNERVRIAKRLASDAELCASFESIELARTGKIESHDSASPSLALPRGERGQVPESSEIPLTYFEFGTLAAMQCFIAHKVEVAILEVGLGGRLDAVNVFDNDCAVIASVDIDHTDYLGDTREKIAFEKAGIFRAGRVAVCADVDVPLAMAEYAEKIGAELWRIGREFGFDGGSPSLALKGPLAIRLGGQITPTKSLVIPRWEREKKAPPVEEGISLPSPNGGGLGGGQWNYHSKVGTRSSLPYPALRGAFQLNNASAALAALDVLKDRLPVSMGAVRRGLGEVQLAGRFQFVPGRPTLILDVAHNPHAARSLAQNLASLPPCPNTFAVFAMLKDKDIAGVIAALDPHIDTWLAAGIVTPRGATAEQVEQMLQQGRVRGEILNCGNISEALRYAYKAADENDRIIAFGSFHTVAEVMAAKGLSVTE